MKIAVRHIRSLLIALVALAMSASLTLGAAAPQAAFGQARALGHTTTNAGSGDVVAAGEDEDTDTDEAEDTEEEEDGGDGGANCATDPTDPATDLTTLTHGQLVCWAAHQETPEGYANHGAWVSEWARGQHGNASAEKTQGKANGKAHGKSKHD
jgi:hypothetical protein